MNIPAVSVVIPCYNRARYLREAIDSVLAQTEPPLEIIVVDDGSTDETPAVLRGYGGAIRVITQANSGVAAARNTGIDAATGDYVALLDSDDSWLPEKLERQKEVVKRWPDVVLVHTLCDTMDSESHLCGDAAASFSPRREDNALERLMSHCYPTTSTYLIRAETLREVGGFDVAFEQGGGFAAEDWELCIRLAERGPFVGIGSILAHYRVHQDSKTLSDKLPHTLGLIALRQEIERRKDSWLAERDSPELRNALDRHRRAFAHVYGRLGLIYQARGDYRAAQDAFGEAARLEPERVKHRIRCLRMKLRARCSAGHGASDI